MIQVEGLPLLASILLGFPNGLQPPISMSQLGRERDIVEETAPCQ